MDMPICEVCNKMQAVGVCSIPGIAMSAAYCKDCLDANAHPVGSLISTIWCCGGWDMVNEEFQEMVMDTCKHLGLNLEEIIKEASELEPTWS